LNLISKDLILKYEKMKKTTEKGVTVVTNIQTAWFEQMHTALQCHISPKCLKIEATAG
jgi:hypothetical protein